MKANARIKSSASKPSENMPKEDGFGEQADTFRVFVSYSRENLEVAEALRDQLVFLNMQKISVFVDTYDIQATADWEAVITDRIRKSDLLIGIYTGKQREKDPFGYPGFEVGAFRAYHADIAAQRIICLYDTEPGEAVPPYFKRYNNCPIEFPDYAIITDSLLDPNNLTIENEFAEKTRLFRFLGDFHGFCLEKWKSSLSVQENEDNRRARIRATKEILKAFYRSRSSTFREDILAARRMVVVIPNGFYYRGGNSQFPEDSTLEPDSYCEVLLNLDGSNNTITRKMSYRWKDINAEHGDKSTTLSWKEQIERCVFLKLSKNSDDGSDLFFVASDGRAYRPYITRNTLIRNGTRRVALLLIPVRSRRSFGDKDTTFILAAVLLGSRFRFLFLERNSEFSAENLENRDKYEFRIGIEQMIRELDMMNLEAAEVGLDNPDILVGYLGQKHRSLISELFLVWAELKMELDAAIRLWIEEGSDERRKEIVNCIKKLQNEMMPRNRIFMTVAVQKYAEIVVPSHRTKDHD